MPRLDSHLHPPSKPILPLLALGSIGGQCVWSTEMAFASPFLLHLGMSKSTMAIVLMAGPISGFVVQPTIGLISDNSKSRWGRRRPLLVASCLLCALNLLQLGFSRSLAGVFTSSEASQNSLTIIFAVLAIICIDFSVNAVNALDRALLLDLVPTRDQSLANAWSARLSGGGSILGFLIGQADLTTMIPFRWFSFLSASAQGQLDTTEAQLRCVCVLVIAILLSTHAVTVTFAKEAPSLGSSSSQPVKAKGGLQAVISSFRQTLLGLRLAVYNLSKPVRDIFRVQFFIWISWFPVLFYSTAWVGAIAKTSNPTMDPAEATRMGSLAMLYHAALSIVGTSLLPILVQKYNQRFPARSRETLASLWSIATLSLALVLLSSYLAEAAGSTRGAMIVIGMTGFAWALSTWAPYALIGIVIQKEARHRAPSDSMSLSHLERAERGGRRRSTALRDDSPEEGAPLMQESEVGGAESKRPAAPQGKAEVEDVYEDESEPDLVYVSQAMEERAQHDEERAAPPSHHGQSIQQDQQSGTITGLHNLSLVIPQFITTVLCTIVFTILEPGAAPVAGHGTTPSASADLPTSPHPFSVVLQLGGLSAFVGAFFAFKLARDHKEILEG